MKETIGDPEFTPIFQSLWSPQNTKEEAKIKNTKKLYRLHGGILFRQCPKATNKWVPCEEKCYKFHMTKTDIPAPTRQVNYYAALSDGKGWNVT